MAEQAPQVMQCMEVWGGSQAAENAVVMSGLDAWVFCKPYANSTEGGDVYYVSSCATGRITRLLVADVSGHGDAVAEISTSLRRLMRQYVNFLDQTQFVESMNQEFVKMSTAACFATAIVTTFFAANGHLSLCNAGHPPPLMYRAKARTWTQIRRANSGETDIADIPLGIMEVCSYPQFEVRLDVGDVVLCYTDSLMESKGANGEMLGVEGLLDVVRTVPFEQPSAFVAKLLEAIGRLAPGNLDADDVTVLLFSPNDTGRQMSFAQKFGAPVRVLRGLAAALRSGEAIPRPDMKFANVGGAVFSPLAKLWRGRRS